jgi:uncharacterized protein (TIGR02145 family)
MKKILFTAILTLIGIHTATAQVGIGTETPATNAALEIVSTTKGLLPPRLSETERDAIPNPAEGLVIFNTDAECLQWWNGNFWYDGCDDETKFCPFKLTKVEEVTSTTGKTWMDRNLGANQAATSSDDSEAYGDLFQWGRAGDGHQCRDSEITNGPVASGIEDNDFIKSDGDWLSTSDGTRWTDDGNKGNHDPCPDGFRIPTQAEWAAEANQNNWGGATDVFNSVLKLTLGGKRESDCNEFGSCSDVSINNLNTGYYWSSTVDGDQSKYLIFDSENISTTLSEDRANGFSVRCIKE